MLTNARKYCKMIKAGVPAGLDGRDMREKVLHGIFSVFSAVMWIFTLASLVFGVVLIAAAPDKAPDVTVKSAVITPVTENDPALAANGKSGGNWYRIDADVRLAANKYSPWTLEADALTVRGREGFCVLPDEGLAFSRAEPQDAVLAVYVRFSGSAEDLQNSLSSLRLCLKDSHTRYGFMRFSLNDNELGFTL